jgi:predicted DNA-binding mobile mystery protein A
LGWTTSQLARKLGVSQPRIVTLENAEIKGTTTLNTLIEAAEAMNCRFEYSFIPQKPIDQFLKERAYEVAKSRVDYVSYHMELEKQSLSEKEKKAQIEQIVEELLNNPKKLWS